MEWKPFPAKSSEVGKGWSEMVLPFKKGDFVTIKEIEGFVHKVDLLYTSLITRLNRIVVIPNSAITSGVIVNHSYEDIVRRRFHLSTSHNSDVKKAKALFYEAVDNPFLYAQQRIIELGVFLERTKSNPPAR
jgi:hypothetical protein